ncbi:type II methionyl aminopeptidase [Nanoarchaeota archaeon]
MDKQKILKAGKIAVEVKKLVKEIVKKDVSLLEIAEKIEGKIVELGGKPAFPVNLSIDEVAAHYTPSHNDESVARGLLKVDFGVHVDGWCSDTAMSFDLEYSEENKKLIEAAEAGLNSAIEVFKEGEELSVIGGVIEKAIEGFDFVPIRNLSGHEMKQYDLHAGVTVPNMDDSRAGKIEKGLYAIEPFATTGAGKVKDGNPSGIYMLINSKNVRSPIAREVLEFISEEYETLPFCSRWIVKKFGTRALFGLRELERNGNLHHFPQLVEAGKGKVAQAEESVFIGEEKVVSTIG